MNILFLCLKIFFARIIDVTLGTLRAIITIKDKIVLASAIGFFETLVWFTIAQEAMNESTNNNLLVGIFYALGFATGTYIGGILSKKVIKGNFSVQIITTKASEKWLKDLRDNGFGVSVMDMKEQDNLPNKYMFFLEINANDFNKLHKITKKYDKNAFIVVNESKTVVNGFFTQK